jgi:hypothetical protein
MNEAQTYGLPGILGSVGMGKEGSALTEIKQLSKGMSDFALDMMGKGPNNTLADIYRILAKGNTEDKNKNVTFSSLAEMKSAIAKGAERQMGQKGDANEPYDKDGYLKELSRAAIIEARKLNAGDTFTDSKGNRYKVKDGYDGLIKNPRAVRMAMGGPVRNYVDGSMGGVWGPGTSKSDSIPAMLSNGEYVLNAAAAQKFGIPLLDRMNGSYNIPSGSISGVNSMSNTSSSNIVYNIDIDLNGTNVTADDIMRKFKSELALVNAKEGRTRSFGGNH